MKHKILISILLTFIFVIGLLLRLYSINWDSNTHLHPDERFLTMVSTTISLPSSVADYFDTNHSPLNPTNYPDYKFFVYGTFPIFLTRFIGHFTQLTGYDQIHLLGRFLSALFDSFVIIGLFFLARLISQKKNSIFNFLPPLLYAFSVLPLQLSHFYAVDTYLSCFLFFTFLFLAFFIKTQDSRFLILSSITFGLAMASKISALYFLPIIALFFLSFLIIPPRIKILKAILLGLLLLIITLISFRVFQPYAFVGLFTPNPAFIDNLKTLSAQSRPDAYFPPSVQWLSKTKIIFPFQNIFFWGVGIPTFLLIGVSLVIHIRKIKLLITPINFLVFNSVFWILFLFFYQGTRFTFAMRYFLPIYPFIFLMAGFLWSRLKPGPVFYILLASHILWGISFLNIYSQPHSRITASAWIYSHIKSGSNLTNEYWDDPLPLYLPSRDPYIYNSLMVPFYDPDSPEKWTKINPIINAADYLIMSSNRLWGSIPKVPHLYPQTSVFYQNLFDDLTPFTPVAKIASYPGFNLPFLQSCFYIGSTDYPYKTKTNRFFEIQKKCLKPGIYFRDDTADESFTVYDHPQVMIFGRRQTDRVIRP